LVSLSSTLTIRSNTGGGGPSIDSNAMVGLSPPAIANEPLAAPLPAQPPSAQAAASRSVATDARRGVRLARTAMIDASLIASCDIVNMH